MAAASCLLSEDQFLCSICLDVFTDPVSTSCGHNFCKKCITEHWDNNDQYLCPMCKKVFNQRPELQVNALVLEMVTLFKKKTEQGSNINTSEQQAVKPGEVPCDVCTGTKLKALKSYLMCLTSCLQPHLTISHQVIDAVENLKDSICMKHHKPLELFCRTDHTCVCMLCTVLEHKTHDVVPLKEHGGQKEELKKTEAEIQQMIKDRRLKIEEIKQSEELSKKSAERETAHGVQVFTALMESVQRSLDEFRKKMEEKQRTTEKQAEDFIKELEQEISELKKRSTEMEHLSHAEDHLYFLQTFTCIKAAPTMKTWDHVRVHPSSYEGTVVRSVSQLQDELGGEMTNLFNAELKRVQQFAVDVTLDPDTANPHLVLSDDMKRVRHSNVKKNLPDNPERFSCCCCILGKQSFSSGRFYFEVQVKEKTDWDFGVARESVNRKGKIQLGPTNGYWTIWLRNGNEYGALENDPITLSLKSRPQKVGVFVDYEEGLVSFYDVDTAALVYSFTGCCFNDKLLPYFGPCHHEDGKNSAPLIITPVNAHVSVYEESPLFHLR